jgi:hypothetical protein
MEQVNTFSEGLTSDVSPLYVKNTQWTFPTINARFYITEEGMSVVNVEGNINENNGSGEEFRITDGYSLIGAYSTMGIGFFFSVNSNDNTVEIGTFPSYVNGVLERKYQPLMNIVGTDKEFRIDNVFQWDVDHLLQMEGKVEFDGTLNMYVVSGKDMLRCFNSGFSLYDGKIIEARHYDRDLIDEQTLVISVPNKDVLGFAIGEDDYEVIDGGNLNYGTYFLYVRMVDYFKNTTPWLYTFGPIMVTGTVFNDYTIGDLYDPQRFSTKQIHLIFPVSMAYEEVEIGVVFYSDRGLNTTTGTPQIQGVLTTKFKIDEDQMSIYIDHIEAESLEDWSPLEAESKLIETVPKTIAMMENRLHIANLQSSIVSAEMLRGFLEKVKLRCVVDPKPLPMPTDTEAMNEVFEGDEEQPVYRTILKREYDEYIGTKTNYTTDDGTYKFIEKRFYYNDLEEVETLQDGSTRLLNDHISGDEKFWQDMDSWDGTVDSFSHFNPDGYPVHIILNNPNGVSLDEDIILRVHVENNKIKTNLAPLTKINPFCGVDEEYMEFACIIVKAYRMVGGQEEEITDYEIGVRRFYPRAFENRIDKTFTDQYLTHIGELYENFDSEWVRCSTPMIVFYTSETINNKIKYNDIFAFGNVLQINKTLTLNTDAPADVSGFSKEAGKNTTITLINPTYCRVDGKMLPTGGNVEGVGEYFDYNGIYFPVVTQMWGVNEDYTFNGGMDIWCNAPSNYTFAGHIRDVREAQLDYDQRRENMGSDYFDRYKTANYFLFRVCKRIGEVPDRYVLEGIVNVNNMQRQHLSFNYKGRVRVIPLTYISGLNFYITPETGDLSKYYEDHANINWRVYFDFGSIGDAKDISITPNDSYYSDQKHVIEDVGYFGGEIYAFSIMAIDKVGNKIGAFAPVGIDHYYASSLNELNYNAFNHNTWDMLADDSSMLYNKTLKKNNKGIYRFPSRSNYDITKSVYGKNKILMNDVETHLIINEKNKGATSYDAALAAIKSTDYLNYDPFNLTHRIFKSYTGERADGRYHFINTLNIFKIEFDFSEAWAWAAQKFDGDKSYASIIRNNIISFQFLRAERNANLQTQGIIQKPNTVLPYPKYYEKETFDLSGSDIDKCMDHDSYSRIISYNFDFIRMPAIKNGSGNPDGTTWNMDYPGSAPLFTCRGQLVNSSIKHYNGTKWGIFPGSQYWLDYGIDNIYPYWHTNYLFTHNLLVTEGWNGYQKKLDTRAFVYSGKWCMHPTSYNWDISDNITLSSDGDEKPWLDQPTTPGLGGVGYMSSAFYRSSAGVYYPSIYYHGVCDFVWGSMSMASSNATNQASNLQTKYRFPIPDVFWDKTNNEDKSHQWYYDERLDGGGNNQAQYFGTGVASFLNIRSRLKIPFFKGYMPCMTIVSYEKADKADTVDRHVQYYTSRCMYFPYDKTRAFFSPDNIMSNMDYNKKNYNYVKPIRKTLYSGQRGFNKFLSETLLPHSFFSTAGHVTGDTAPRDGTDSLFLNDPRLYYPIIEDGWKTVFARPAAQQLRGRPIASKNSGDEAWGEFYKLGATQWDYGYNVEINEDDAVGTSAAGGVDKNGAIGVTPGGVLHQMRKLFKIEDPRACFAIDKTEKVSPYDGHNRSYNYFPGARSQNINETREIGYSENAIQKYICGAFDVYEHHDYGDVNRKKNKSFFFKDGGIASGVNDILFGTSTTDVGKGHEQGDCISTNRNFEFCDYIAFSFNVGNNTVPEHGVGYLNYENYINVTDRYIVLTRKNMQNERKSTGKNYNQFYNNGGESTEMDYDNFQRCFTSCYDQASGGTDQRQYRQDTYGYFDKYKDQYEDIDIHIDTNYEDLTICNIYKHNPETINDITSYYNVHSIPYYEIGKAALDKNSPVGKVKFGKGDCFLDRTYFKHTAWFNESTNKETVPRDIYAYGDKDGDHYKNSNVMLLGNKIGIAGAENDFTSAYKTVRSMANLSYAHGITLGVITENKFNIGLRGNEAIAASSTGTYNLYPLSENGREISPSVDNFRGTEVNYGKNHRSNNLFLLYPNNALSGSTGKEDHTMNFAYSKVLSDTASYMSDSVLSDLKEASRTRIRWSAKAIEGSYADGWKEWKYADFIDYPQKFGEIKRLIVFNDTLMSFLNDAFFQHMYLGEQVQVTEEQYLSIGGARILSDQVSIAEGYGLSHAFGILATETGVYAVDANRDLIYRIGMDRKMNGSMGIAAPENILKTIGINTWAKSYFAGIREHLFGDLKKVSDRSSEIPDSPFLGNGIVIGYDRKYNEVLISFRYSNDMETIHGSTLVFSEMLNKFTSLYSMTPYMFANINDDIYSVDNQDFINNRDMGVINRSMASFIYKHNNEHSPRQSFHNRHYKPFKITFIVNGITSEANLGMFMKQFNAMTVESQQEPFTSIEYMTKDQQSIIPFIDNIQYWTMPEYLSHHWQVPIHVDTTSITEQRADYGNDYYYRDSAMVGDWLRVTIEYSNRYDYMKEIKPIFITSVMTNFNLSRA